MNTETYADKALYQPLVENSPFDSARQSQIEALRSDRGSPSLFGKGDEEDRFGKAAASQNENFQQVAGITHEMNNVHELPKLFRIPQKSNNPSLAKLNCSASSQFSDDSLACFLNQIPTKKMAILDLREESHGFINGIAISWYKKNYPMNIGKSADEIIADETERLKNVQKQPTVIIKFPEGNQEIYVQTTATEGDLASKYGLSYFRLPVTNYFRPRDEIVDTFVEIMRKYSADTWFHYHCKAGRGRTTTFLVMHDILLNASEDTLEDIFTRHALQGGVDFNETLDPNSPKYQSAVMRLNFLKEFYLYSKTGYHTVFNWSEWLNHE